MGVEQEGEKKAPHHTHQRGEPEHFCRSDGLVWSSVRAPPWEGQSRLSILKGRAGPGGGTECPHSLPQPPRKPLIFSKEALDARGWGLEPVSRISQEVRPVRCLSSVRKKTNGPRKTKEALGVQAAGVSRGGCCAGTQAESKALVVIAIVGGGEKVLSLDPQPRTEKREQTPSQNPDGGTLWSTHSAGSPGWLPGLRCFSVSSHSLL